jgi:hypothetical protein
LLPKGNAKYEVTQKNLILETIHSGVLSDEIIQVEVDKGSMKTKLKLRNIQRRAQKNLRLLASI